MNKREQLSLLLVDSIKKSESYINAVRQHGQDESPEVERLRQEWEAAEDAYSACLDEIKDSLLDVVQEDLDGIPSPSVKGLHVARIISSRGC